MCSLPRERNTDPADRVNHLNKSRANPRSHLDRCGFGSGTSLAGGKYGTQYGLYHRHIDREIKGLGCVY